LAGSIIGAERKREGGKKEGFNAGYSGKAQKVP
jgi:hypothetical protein